MWSAYLGKKISARDVCMLNILQKVSRDLHGQKFDNLVDIAGYAENAYLVERPDFSYAEDAPLLACFGGKLMKDREFSEWIQAVQQVLKADGVNFTQASQRTPEGYTTCTFAWLDNQLTEGAAEALMTVLNRGCSLRPSGWTNVTIWNFGKVTFNGEEIL